MINKDCRIQTYTGKQFYLLDTIQDDIDVVDIAHALANMCRFNGHCNEFYSVAQHSVIVSQYCDDPLWGLAHDMTEAYLPDVTRPLKQVLPNFKVIEDNLMSVIAQAFGLNGTTIPDQVKVIDNRALVTERRDLMADAPIPWGGLHDLTCLPQKIVPVSAKMAEKMFLRRFHELVTVEV